MYIFGISIPLAEFAIVYISLIILFLVVFIIQLRRLRLYLSTEFEEVKEFDEDIVKLGGEEEALEAEERELGREENMLKKDFDRDVAGLEKDEEELKKDDEKALIQEEKSEYLPKAIKMDIKLRRKKIKRESD